MKLNKLQGNKNEDNKFELSRVQKEEIRQFKLEQMNVKRKRREVRKNLRQDIESLGNSLTAANIGIVPIFVLVFGLFVYFRRTNGLGVFGKRRP